MTDLVIVITASGRWIDSNTYFYLQKMNSNLKKLLIASIVLSVMASALAAAENKFLAITKTRAYAEFFGTTAIVSLLLVAGIAIGGSIWSYRNRRTRCFLATLGLAFFAIVGVCLPNQARAIQDYCSHEQRCSRFISSLNDELRTDRRFEDIRLSYWYGKGEGCDIEGTVRTDRDLIMVEAIVKTRTSLYVHCDATVTESGAD